MDEVIRGTICGAWCGRRSPAPVGRFSVAQPACCATPEAYEVSQTGREYDWARVGP